MKDVESTLEDRLAALIVAMGYEFVGCEFHRRSKNSLLRIYIDTEKGVTVDDCSKVSYQVSAMLDVEDPIQGNYSLEISSPGIDRPLFQIAHYQKSIGKQVKIRLYHLVQGRRNFVGTVLRVENADIYLSVDGKEVDIPFASIEKGKLISEAPHE